jgi:tetrapyrrole methylase family protein / MazG family protein
MTNSADDFIKLLGIVAKLRNPQGGCPWDLEQTHVSLKPFVIEEAYEVIQAIDEHPDKLCEELGDLLLQVLLHAQIASEEKRFDISNVMQAISEKLIRRHPHVFSDVKVDSSAQVLKNWEQLKQQELEADKSILDGVPRGMPALLRSQRLGDKAARVGFDWEDVKGVEAKVLEEVRELVEAQAGKSSSDDLSAYKHELGDVLFSLVQLARRTDLNAEDLLHAANDRFTSRFRCMEKLTTKPLKELSVKELDELWERAKKEG